MKRKVISLISFILCLAMLLGIGSVSYAASNFTTKSRFTGETYTHYGSYAGTTVKDMIDVSEHNGLINWYKIKALGIDDAIIRVGYRGYGKAGTMREDNYYYDNVEGALKAGVNIGLYFYSQALNTTEAKDEAKYVLNRVKNYKLSLPIFFDYEFAEVSDGRLDAAWASGKLNKTKMTANVIAFCDTIKAAGYKAGIYSSSGFYTYQYNADTFLSKGYYFWNAYYTTNSTSGSYWPNKNHVYKYWQYGGGNVQGCCGSPSSAWLKVTYGAYTGYVCSQYINFTGAKSGTSLTSGLNLRKGAGTGYGVVTTIPKGGKVTILSYPTSTNTDLNFYYYSGKTIGKPSFSLTPGQNSIQAAWSAVAGAAYYRVYLYKGNNEYERVAQTTSTAYTLSGLKANTKYTLLVRAFSGGAASKFTTADNKSAVTLPDKPQLTVSKATEKSITLTWKKVGGTAYYRVYSYDNATKKYTRLAQVTGTTYSLSGLKSGSSNYLLARAFTAAGTGSSYTLKDVKCFHSVPSAPRFTLKSYSYAIKLSWNNVTGAQFYRVYAYDAASGKYTRLAQTTGTTWKHEYLEGNSSHTYLVRAFIEGERGSAYTAADRQTAMTRPAKPQFTLTTQSNTAIRVSWSAVEGAAYYKVYLYNAESDTYTTLVKTAEQEYLYTRAQAGRQYSFLVRAFRSNGEGSTYSASDRQRVVTLAKASFSLSSTAKGTVDVKWKTVPDAAFYRVYSYDKATGKYARLAQVTATTYRLSKLTSGKQYTYLVRAFSNAGYACDYTTKDNKTIVVK